MQTPSHSKPTTRIFLNPKFKKPKVHVNPNFFKSNPTIIPGQDKVLAPAQAKIYINPKFLKESITANYQSNKILQPSPLQPPLVVVTRRKLIRASNEKTDMSTRSNEPSSMPSRRLHTLSRNKLIRYQPQKVKIIPIQKTISRPSKSKYKLKNLLQSTFKIDRRSSKLASSKGAAQKNTGHNFQSNHKKLVRVNINGVAYNSSRTKLQRSTSKTSSERVLIVRGEKFQLDANGTHLFKIDGEGPRKRIDIGGVTFVKNSSTNTFVRTDSHLARNHLNSTKHRSITVLSRNLVKHNQPCSIYRRLGKCLAFARGRCPKIHDPNQISICPRFLKGQCAERNCLLSHKVSLSKMPTCKFFLKGVCVNSDCPYLHKKVNRSTEICENFSKGFCILADKCPMRHEFECPDFEANGQCAKMDCAQVHRRKRGTKTVQVKTTDADEGHLQRYYSETNETIRDRRERVLAKVQRMKEKFTAEQNTDHLETARVASQKRTKLGATPAFIPI